ncbi:MAG: HAMP domain-containing protein [Nitrospinae bacterium]|nr:HAMP domain-containing protein [Nitrospinota bacterium]
MIRWRLRNKLILLMGGLVVGLLLVTLLLVDLWATRQAHRTVINDLRSTQMVFEQFQRARFERLLSIARILGREYALRTAVATYDPATVLSAGKNFQARAKSDLFLVTDETGKVLARTDRPRLEGVAEDLSSLPAIQQALDDKESTHLWRVQDKVYQVVSVPLKAGTDLLGTLSLGFELNDAVAAELKAMTRSEITFLVGGRVVASTWTEAARQDLLRQASRLSGQWSTREAAELLYPLVELPILGESYLSLVGPLQGLGVKGMGFKILQRSLDEALAFLRSLRRAMVAVGGLVVAVALVSSFLIARGVTAPVQQLVQGTQAVAEGNYQYRISLASRDELGVLARSYNTMAQALQEHTEALKAAYADLQQKTQALESTLRKVELLEQVKGHLSKFVPESVRRIIERAPTAPDLEKQEKDVSTLFLDVQGYTRLSERMSREQMNELLERYFSSFLDDIYQHNGDINETAGDGLMIIFQHDDPIQHAVDAVKTALAIRYKVDKLNAQLQGPYEPMVVNIGINSGVAAVGSTRFQGLTGTRWTFTASGPVTNLAARLGGLATNGRVLLGPETANRVKGYFALKSVGEVELKNVQEPTLVYEVLTDAASDEA